jgi:hypothetical protein
MLSIHYSRQDASLTAHESLYYITQGTLVWRLAGGHFSDARGVCCCSSTSLSPARVSTPSTFSPRMPAPMPCAHLRATLRFRSRLLPHTLMCATHASLYSGAYRCETPRGEAARRLAPAHRLLLRSPPPVARLSRSARRSGRVGRYGPRTHPCESRPHARSLAARSAVQRPRLPPRLRPCLPWLQARPPSSSQEPVALRSARP